MELGSAIWASLLSALLSGLVVFAVSAWFQRRRERRREKLDVFSALMANRHGLLKDGNSDANTRFFAALNSVFVVFHDSEPVLRALLALKQKDGDKDANLTRLLRAMSTDVHLSTNDLDDSIYDEPFAPGNR